MLDTRVSDELKKYEHLGYAIVGGIKYKREEDGWIDLGVTTGCEDKLWSALSELEGIVKEMAEIVRDEWMALEYQPSCQKELIDRCRCKACHKLRREELFAKEQVRSILARGAKLCVHNNDPEKCHFCLGLTEAGEAIGVMSRDKEFARATGVPTACCYCGEGSQDHETCRKAVEWERSKQSDKVKSLAKKAAEEAAKEIKNCSDWQESTYAAIIQSAIERNGKQ